MRVGGAESGDRLRLRLLGRRARLGLGMLHGRQSIVRHHGWLLGRGLATAGHLLLLMLHHDLEPLLEVLLQAHPALLQELLHVLDLGGGREPGLLHRRLGAGPPALQKL